MQLRSAPLNNSGPVHTVFSAECNPTFDWHSVALFHSHAKSGQPGGITRLLACEPAKLRTYRGLDIGPTFVHHNHRGKKGMNYAAFNKPVSTVRTPRRPGSASCTRASVEPKKDLRRGPRSGDADPEDAVSATSSSSASARRSRIGTSDIRVRAPRPRRRLSRSS